MKNLNYRKKGPGRVHNLATRKQYQAILERAEKKNKFLAEANKQQ